MNKRRKCILGASLSLAIVLLLTACGGTEKPENYNLGTATVNITADKGWTEKSTPAIVHIKGLEDNDDVDFYHAVKPSKDNKGTYETDLEIGSYEVSIISPVNKDGSAYELFETEDAKTLTVEITEKDAKDDKANTVDMKMKHISADKVTDEMLTTIVTNTKAAIEKGDETLKGDNGKAVLDILDKNVKENPNADKAKEETEEVKETAKVDEKPVATPEEKAEVQAQAPVNKPSNNAPTSKPSSNDNQSTSKPSHTHHWKDHTATKQVWVSKIVPVYETKRVQVGTKQVSDGSYWHCTCGAVIKEGPAAKEHRFNHIENDEPSNGYNEEHFHEEPVYENRKVQVGTKDEGHYETKTYVDYKYCKCGAKK